MHLLDVHKFIARQAKFKPHISQLFRVKEATLNYLAYKIHQERKKNNSSSLWKLKQIDQLNTSRGKEAKFVQSLTW